MKHFGIYTTGADVQSAVDAGSLLKPYVAKVGEGLDYNTLSPTPPAPSTMGVWSDDGQGVYTFQILDADPQYWGANVKIGSLDGVYYQSSEDQIDMDVFISWDTANEWWNMELQEVNLSEYPSQAFADGTPDTWLQESVVTDPNESSASLEVSWDGVDTFVFQRNSSASGPALSMTTINPPYPAGE